MSQNAAEIAATALNFAFALIAQWRAKGMTEQEIAERLDGVDQGEEAITVDEVIAAEETWQTAIDEGRQIP